MYTWPPWTCRELHEHALPVPKLYCSVRHVMMPAWRARSAGWRSRTHKSDCRSPESSCPPCTISVSFLITPAALCLHATVAWVVLLHKHQSVPGRVCTAAEMHLGAGTVLPKSLTQPELLPLCMIWGAVSHVELSVVSAHTSTHRESVVS